MIISKLLPAILCSALLLTACSNEKSPDDTKQNDTGTAIQNDTGTATQNDSGPNTQNDTGPNTQNDTGTTDKSPLNCDEVNRTQSAKAIPENHVEPGKQTLSGTYLIDGRIIFDKDQDLTIEPGTVFLMGPESQMIFGWRGDPAQVTARGTAQKPILFCGTAKTAGHWNNLIIEGGTKLNSVFEHIRIEDAGHEEFEYALVVEPEVDLKSVGIYNSGSAGMLLEKLGKNSENLTVKGSKLHPLRLTSSSAITNLPSGDYTGNGTDVIHIPETGIGDFIFHDRGIPYRQVDTRIQWHGDKTSVTFSAGVEYQLCEECFIEVASGDDGTPFNSKGTAQNPVVFTSASTTPAPGDWNGLRIRNGFTDGSSIEYTEFHYGGEADGANLLIEIEPDRSFPITNSKFINSAGYGIFIEYPDFDFDPSTNTFEGNAQGDTNLP